MDTVTACISRTGSGGWKGCEIRVDSTEQWQAQGPPWGPQGAHTSLVKGRLGQSHSKSSFCSYFSVNEELLRLFLLAGWTSHTLLCTPQTGLSLCAPIHQCMALHIPSLICICKAQPRAMVRQLGIKTEQHFFLILTAALRHFQESKPQIRAGNKTPVTGGGDESLTHTQR